MDKTESEPKKGRPRKYDQASERVDAYRKRKQAEGRRLDIFLLNQASWRITALAKAWDCSRGAAIERLIMEADQKYESILFPVTESD
ncbi:MAG: hypothetical protein WC001_05325 [Desulfurivibrionaceae bacterium]